MFEKKLLDSDKLVLNYLSKSKGLEFTRQGNMFILWKLSDNVLEIHDIYSEDGPGDMLSFAENFIKDFKGKIIEGYIEKDYSEKERSKKILENFGMSFYKETEEFYYYRMFNE